MVIFYLLYGLYQVIDMTRYSNREYTHMIFVLGACNGNVSTARLYRKLYSNHVYPNRQVIKRAE